MKYPLLQGLCQQVFKLRYKWENVYNSVGLLINVTIFKLHIVKIFLKFGRKTKTNNGDENTNDREK